GLPGEEQPLFDGAALRIACQRAGVTEVTTFRDQIRLRPLALPERLEVDLALRVGGARYHRTTQTLNLQTEPSLPGRELPARVRRGLEDATEVKVDARPVESRP